MTEHPDGPVARRGIPRRAFLRGAGGAVVVAACADEPGGTPTADATVDATADAGGDASDDAASDGTADLRDDFDDYTWDGAPGPDNTFSHGVASGDPLSTAVILWTRVTSVDDEVDVRWEVSRDEAFTQRVAVGTVQTGPRRDHTVKLDVEGLQPGTTYWYRFFALGRGSLVGRTRTAAVGTLERARIAFCSCSRFDNGWFHAYRALAEQPDVDVVLHLGDYIYEYGANPEALRPFDPPHEIVTLDDYRRRYRQYHSDPDLQAARAAHPFVAVWDDHESTNNAYMGGAQNHQPDEGDWNERKLAAWQAWSEWLPTRDTDPLRIWRSLQFGDLVDLWMLDTRLWGRDAPVEAGGDADDPERQILGADQEAWLFEGLRSSTATWRVLGQQVPMAINRSPGFDFVGDKWGEYAAARSRLFRVVRDEQLDNFIVLSGDIHCSWAIDLAEDPYDAAAYDPATGAGALGVEFVIGGITQGAFTGELAQEFGAVVVRDEAPVQYANIGDRGYGLLDIDRDRIVAQWRFVTTVTEEEHARIVGAEVRVASGQPHAALNPEVAYGTPA